MAVRRADRRAARPQAKTRERLDVLMVSRGLSPSREQAARLILAGTVLVDGQRVDKAGALVTPSSR
ncbi:MAG TPA: S4 domain-containing protein, partial [Methylomirabilota bacterium]|nr:S4 domain-containing protein [Methylomirabilota bacterium]